MFSSITSWLIRSSASIPGYDEHGVHEFSLPGPLQNYSWYIALGTIVCSVVLWMFLPIRDVSVRPVYVVLMVMVGVTLITLIVTNPIVRKYHPWEWHRWLRRHILLHFVLTIVYTDVVFSWIPR